MCKTTRLTRKVLSEYDFTVARSSTKKPIKDAGAARPHPNRNKTLEALVRREATYC